MTEPQWLDFKARRRAILDEIAKQCGHVLNVWWDPTCQLTGRWRCQVVETGLVRRELSQQVDRLTLEFIDTAKMRIASAWIKELSL